MKYLSLLITIVVVYTQEEPRGCCRVCCCRGGRSPCLLCGRVQVATNKERKKCYQDIWQKTLGSRALLFIVIEALCMYFLRIVETGSREHSARQSFFAYSYSTSFLRPLPFFGILGVFGVFLGGWNPFFSRGKIRWRSPDACTAQKKSRAFCSVLTVCF